MSMYDSYIKVEGSSYERGKKIGALLSEQIKANYNNQVYFYKGKENFEYANWEAIAERRYIPIIQKWAPEVIDELKGMAEGSGMAFRQLLGLTTAYEKSFAVDAVADKCTSFLLAGEATKQGEVIIGQTNDEDSIEWINKLDVVIHHKDLITGNEMLIYTHPGVPAYMGMNNRGLAVLWTYIDNGKIGEGLPTCVIMRHLLELDDVAACVEFLESVPHDIPNEFGLGDKSGDMACVECFPNAVYVHRDANSMVHTNHNRFCDPEPECTASATTFARCASMERLIKQNYGSIDAAMCEDFLRHHDGTLGSICVHPCGDRPWRQTFSAMVYELTTGKMDITIGNPCKQEYSTYGFDTYR